MKLKLLISGQGGGLDVVNASAPYFSARFEGVEVRLGSVKTAPLSLLEGHVPFSDSGALVNPNTRINFKGRYTEPRISQQIGEDVFYFARNYGSDVDIQRLSDSIKQAKEKFGFTHLFFIDAGGDALQLTDKDEGEISETVNPFEGQDAQVLESLVHIPNSYLGVISAGLDISPEAFSRNVRMLDERGAYFGRVNLREGEKDNYQLNHVLPFNSGFLNRYIEFAERNLVLCEEDLKNPEKTMSLTAVVTYHALKGNYGTQKIFFPWKPYQKDIIVKPEHCWMYFSDATKIHPLKLELNK